MRFIFLLSVGFMLYACSNPEFLTPEELQSFVLDEENGLKKIVEIADYKIEVVNRPTDLWVQQEIGGKLVDDTTLDQLRKKYDSYYYFVVSLSRDNKEALHNAGGGMEKYSELVQTLSFQMANYANLTTSKQDTIPVGDFMLNRTFGMSASTDLLFVFSREKATDNEWIQFNLNEFGLGIGNQRFRFKREDLDNAPKIKFEQQTTSNADVSVSILTASVRTNN